MTNRADETGPESTSRASRLRFGVLAAFVIAVALATSFGPVMDDAFPTHDDNAWLRHTRLMTVGGASGASEQPPKYPLHERVIACFTDPHNPAHYQPFTRAVWVLVYAATDDEHWMAACLTLAMVLHAGTALLLVLIMRRLALPRPVALLAGVFFVAHPVADFALNGINGTINVYPLFFLFLTMVLWQPTMPGHRLRPLLLVAASLSLLACLSSNPPFIAAAPLVLAWLAFVDYLRERPPFWRWCGSLAARMSPFVAVVGITIATRILWYGTALTRVKRGTTFLSGENPISGWWSEFVTFTKHAVSDGRSGKRIALPEGHGIETADVTVAGLGVLIVALAVWHAFRRSDRDARPWRAGPFARAAVLALGLIVLLNGTYYAAIGASYLHRYLYIGIPGFGVLFALVPGLAAGALRRWRLGTPVAVAFSVALLAAYSHENVRSVTSAVYGFRVARVVADGVADVMWEHPELERSIVLNLPTRVGRAGYVFYSDGSLNQAVGFSIWRRHGVYPDHWTRKGRGIFHEPELLRRWDKLAESEELRRSTAVLYLDRRSLRLEIVAEVRNATSLDHPGPLRFETALRIVHERGQNSRVVVNRDPLDVSVTADGVRLSGAVRSLRNRVARDPEGAARDASSLVERHGRELEGTLIQLIERGASRTRHHAADALTRLWELDDGETTVSLIRSPHRRRARAAARIAAMMTESPSSEVVASALDRDETSVDFLLERARRRDTRFAESLQHLADESRDAVVLCRIRAALLMLGTEGTFEPTAGAALDTRLPLFARLEALEAVLMSGDWRAPAIVDALGRSEPPESELWRRSLDLVTAADGVAERLLWTIASRDPSPDLMRRCGDRWQGGDSERGSFRKRVSGVKSFWEVIDSLVVGEGAKGSLATLRRLKSLGIETEALPAFWPTWVDARSLASRGRVDLDVLVTEVPDGRRADIADWLALSREPNRWAGTLAARIGSPPAVRPLRPGDVVPVLVELVNEGDSSLMVGPSPQSPRIELLGFDREDPSQISWRRSYLLPCGRIAPGESLRLPLPVELWGTYGTKTILVRVASRRASKAVEFIRPGDLADHSIRIPVPD